LKGGVALSQGNQSFLRFSLEESVWFQRGQEVDELVSISLDPNITIQENDQYVTIRGSLDLTGEYQCQSEKVDEDNGWPTVQKWVNSVEVREDGISEFSHQFPVDITIPTYRVRDLSEVDVVIETFDYLLPERSCLKLTAELNISGLYGEQTAVVEQEEEEEEEEEAEVVFELAHRNQGRSESPEDDSDFAPFEVEARKEEKFFTEPTLAESSSHQTTPEILFSAQRSEQPPLEQEPVEEVQPIAEEENFPVGDEVETEQPEESPKTTSPSVTEKLVNLKNKLTNKKSMSISEFLGRKEGEDHARLKVCIVQHGESVETLANRYDVSVQQLLKVNSLELNQDVYEGQVLYVPQVSAKK
jgi:stage VI sporulation protein D